MYIRKSTRKYKGKSYTNYLLVESIQTSKGPRQRIICSLGSMEPGPAEELARTGAQTSIGVARPEVAAGFVQSKLAWVERARRSRGAVPPVNDRPGSAIIIEAGKIDIEHAREAGPVHAGHQIWNQIGLNRILQEAGLSERACKLTEAMTLNRLIHPLSEHAMPDWIRRTASGDILETGIFPDSRDEALYRNLDRLHPNREHIERALAEKRKDAV